MMPRIRNSKLEIRSSSLTCGARLLGRFLGFDSRGSTAVRNRQSTIVSCQWPAALILALSLTYPASVANAQVSDWKQIHIPPLHFFNAQQPRRVELANGMVIFLQEDHELPLIRGTAVIRGGSREEPVYQAGLTAIYGEVWRTGGTKNQTGDELDDYLDARAAKLESGSTIDSTSLNWDCLKDDFDEVFKVFVELLKEPEFREDKIPLAKNELVTTITRRYSSPTALADSEALKLVYGAYSPYAKEAQ